MDGGDDGKMRKGTGYYSLKAIPAVMLLLALFIIPIALTFSDAFKDGGDAILAVLRDDYTYHLLSFTLLENESRFRLYSLYSRSFAASNAFSSSGVFF